MIDTVAERVRSYVVSVVNEEIIWAVSDSSGELTSGTKQHLHLPIRRRETVEMLVRLLRSSTDVECPATDLEHSSDRQGKLYQGLLNVVGHELFGLLFVNDLGESVLESLTRLRDGDVDRLRIRLQFDGTNESWLSRLPWEYTRTVPGESQFSEDGVFLSQAAQLILSRKLNLKSFRPLQSQQWPIRVLLVFSSPQRGGVKPVHAQRLIEQMREYHRDAVIDLRELIELPWSDPLGPDDAAIVTESAFAQAIDEHQPAIVHFVGHGRCSDGAGALAFSDENGAERWSEDSQVASALSMSKQLKLVFLQACESAFADPYVSFSGVARRIAGTGVPAVVGMQYRITAGQANAFARAFYKGLLEERLPISYAVQAARATMPHMQDRDKLAFGLPVLYLGEDGTLGEPPDRPVKSPPLDRSDGGAATVTCPRCAAELTGLDQKVCHACGLLLICPEPGCRERYVDPVEDIFCRHCQGEVRRRPYTPDSLATGSVHSNVVRGVFAVARGRGTEEPR